MSTTIDRAGRSDTGAAGPAPGRAGPRRARRRARRTGRPTARTGRRSCSCPTWSIVPLAPSGRRRSPISRGASASSRSTAAATGCRTGRRTPSAYDDARVRRRRARRARRRRRRVGMRRRARPAAACWALLLAGRHPERVDGAFADRPVDAAEAPTPPSRDAHRTSTRSSRRYEGWAKCNRHYWLARLPRLPRVLLRASVFTEPHSTKQIEDASRSGSGDDAGDAGRDRVGGDSLAGYGRRTDERGRGALPQRPLPGRSSCMASDDRDHAARAQGAARRAHRRRAVPARGRGPFAAGRAIPCRVNLLLRDFAERCTRACRRARTWTRGVLAAAARAVRVVADRARPRLARRRDRRRAAPRRCPASRSTGSRRTRSRACSTRAARRSTRRAPSSPTRRRTSTARRGEHDLHAFQAMRRMDEILVRELHGLRRRRARTSRYDLWIGDEAWEVDHFLHENPELKTAPLRLADRLRRLPADARGRRARGRADRRLQRGDDRARRALPARPRPRDLRRRPGGRRARAVRPGAAGDPRLDASAHFSFAGYVHGLRPADALPDRAALRAELGYGPASRSASSPSAARASARRCCAA